MIQPYEEFLYALCDETGQVVQTGTSRQWSLVKITAKALGLIPYQGEFPTGWVNLNTGKTAPKPPPVMEYIDPAVQLAAWRANARPYRAAMMKALGRIRVGPGTLLDVAQGLILSPNAAIAFNDVIQFYRTHPDVLLWTAPLMGAIGAVVTPEFLDHLFREALALETDGLDDIDSKEALEAMCNA